MWPIIDRYAAVRYCTAAALINHLHVTPTNGEHYSSILCTHFSPQALYMRSRNLTLPILGASKRNV
jgi:hypothetical protein